MRWEGAEPDLSSTVKRCEASLGVYGGLGLIENHRLQGPLYGVQVPARYKLAEPEEGTPSKPVGVRAAGAAAGTTV